MKRLLLLGLFLPCLLWKCSDSGDTCGDASCDATADAKSPKDSTVTDSGSCDPKTTPECVSETFGIFVDGASGNDSNPGTKASPVKTIGHALTILVGSKARVFVCEGTYPEDVVMGMAVDGKSLYGGLSCTDWTYTGRKSQIGKGPVALTLDSLSTAKVTVADFYVQAGDGVAPGESSIAAFVNFSTDVTFLRMNLSAGKGAPGKNATTGSNYNGSLAQTDPTIAGHAGVGLAGGATQTCASLCTDTTASTGGQGGAGGATPFDGEAGAPPSDAGGGGGIHAVDAGCSAGQRGVDAMSSLDAKTPINVGTIKTTGWVPASGSDGKNGAVAQGGGGGGGGIALDAGGGGGGGCGGCGGAGGIGGGGGGGSIALAILNSSLAFTMSELHAFNGGAGGNGAIGQTGQLGGNGGTANPPGCTGGPGGNGGKAGAGAGGAGGVSVAILWNGANAPTLDGATTGALFVATPGAKGQGGTPGINDGIDGVALTIFPSP